MIIDIDSTTSKEIVINHILYYVNLKNKIYVLFCKEQVLRGYQLYAGNRGSRQYTTSSRSESKALTQPRRNSTCIGLNAIAPTSLLH